jgi:hypothetical protein
VTALVAATEYAAAANAAVDALRAECMDLARANSAEHTKLREMETGIKGMSVVIFVFFAPCASLSFCATDGLFFVVVVVFVVHTTPLPGSRATCDELEARLARLARQQDAVMARFSPAVIGRQLAAAAARIDRETAQLEADLAAGKTEPQAFARTFAAKRAQRHRYTGLRDCLARQFPNIQMT